jgi:hypothetical protein
MIPHFGNKNSLGLLLIADARAIVAVIRGLIPPLITTLERPRLTRRAPQERN